MKSEVLKENTEIKIIKSKSNVIPNDTNTTIAR